MVSKYADTYFNRKVGKCFHFLSERKRKKEKKVHFVKDSFIDNANKPFILSGLDITKNGEDS